MNADDVGDAADSLRTIEVLEEGLAGAGAGFIDEIAVAVEVAE